MTKKINARFSACGENGHPSNSGTGDEFPRRESTEDNPPVAAETACLSPNWTRDEFPRRESTENSPPVAAETSCLSPNWTSDHFRHRLMSFRLIAAFIQFAQRDSVLQD
jgi:hypothetical protein